MWRNVWIVFQKEVVDNSRDRRTLLMAMVYPLLGPMLLGVMIGAVSGVVKTGGAGIEPSTWYVVGKENAPGSLREHLDANKVSMVDAPEDPQAAIKNGEMEAVVVLPENFGQVLDEKQTVQIEVLIDNSRIAGLMNYAKITQILRRYDQKLGEERMREIGVDPDYPKAIKAVSVNVSSEDNKLVDFFLYMVPPFIIFTIFMGGFYLAVDTTAGERERGSMETLMINPVPRWGLMAGKYMATLLYTLFALLVQLSMFELVFTFLSSRGTEFNRTLGLETIVLILIVGLPLAGLAVALQVIIATVTRTYKEAQTWLGLLPLVPAAPALVMVFITTTIQPWMMVVPIFSQTILLGQLVRQEDLEVAHVATSIGLTTLVVIGLLLMAGKFYDRENMAFTD